MNKLRQAFINKFASININQYYDLRQALRMIPMAGSLIESQLLQLGQYIGETVTLTFRQNLTYVQTLQPIYQQIAQTISQINTTNPALEWLVSDVINDSLTALANQVKIQQWTHQTTLNTV